MKGFLKFLIWFLVCMQALLVLFIVFSKFFEKEEKAITVEENEFADVFMPKFEKAEITGEIKERMSGNSYVKNDDIELSNLNYLTIAYYDFEGGKKNGEMIVNAKIADEVLEIFEVLYENKFPIERMELIDNYGGDDYASIEANNTSSFCYRKIEGSTTLSQHAYGLAIDINPLQNPQIKKGTTSHKKSEDYIDRSNIQKGMIFPNDICVETFTKYGWTWGGTFSNIDYQHFEKVIVEEEKKEEKVNVVK